MSPLPVPYPLVPKQSLGTHGREALLRGESEPDKLNYSSLLSVRRSRASGPGVPKQSLGTRETWKMCPLSAPYRWLFFFVLFCVFCGYSPGSSRHAPVQKATPCRLLIAFGSYRDRPKHPNIFFYEHDGIGNGKIVGKVGTAR